MTENKGRNRPVDKSSGVCLQEPPCALAAVGSECKQFLFTGGPSVRRSGCRNGAERDRRELVSGPSTGDTPATLQEPYGGVAMRHPTRQMEDPVRFLVPVVLVTQEFQPPLCGREVMGLSPYRTISLDQNLEGFWSGRSILMVNLLCSPLSRFEPNINLNTTPKNNTNTTKHKSSTSPKGRHPSYTSDNKQTGKTVTVPKDDNGQSLFGASIQRGKSANLPLAVITFLPLCAPEYSSNDSLSLCASRLLLCVVVSCRNHSVPRIHPVLDQCPLQCLYDRVV